MDINYQAQIKLNVFNAYIRKNNGFLEQITLTKNYTTMLKYIKIQIPRIISICKVIDHHFLEKKKKKTNNRI